MARSTKTTAAAAKRAPEPAPKKRIGRPVGSKNRAPVAKTKPARAAATPQKAGRKVAAPATPKMNKAELEAQVVKLERTIARLRKANADLKQTARAEPVEAPKPAPAAAPTPAKKPKRAAAPKTRKPAKSAAQQDAPAPDSEGDSESSDD